MMGSSKTMALLLISMLFFSSLTPILSCGSCDQPTTKPKPRPTHPKNPRPPKSPKRKPAPVVLPPITVPPVTPVPPVIPVPVLPPGTGGKSPPTTKPPCPPTTPTPPAGTGATCPVDAVKLGACVDLLGGLVHIGLGDPVVNQCCPVLKGLVELEAAVCLCTTLKLKLLNLNIYLPLALQLLITCGKTPPPGYTCTL